MVANPNYFGKLFTLGASTSGDVAEVIDSNTGKPFEATHLRILNTSAFDLYLKLGATGKNAASTTDFRVRACSDYPPFEIPTLSSLAAKTTTTAGAQEFHIAFLGG